MCIIQIKSVLNIKLEDVENKILDVSKIVTSSSLNKKIEKIGKKIPDHTNIYLLQKFKSILNKNIPAKSIQNKS